MKISFKKTALVCSVALITLASSTGGYAQKRAGTDEVETIIVTAQKRAENLQSTPVTVHAFSESALKAAGAFQTMDLQTLVPGLTYNHNLTAAAPYIRGVGQTTGALGVESPIAVYMDGVYLVAPAAGLFSFSNIRQIEVAKGPQGTLFGRNTTGGVIQIFTKQPSATPEFAASVGYGNYDTISGDFYASGAILPHLAANISVSGLKRRDGYINDLSLNRKLGQKEHWSVQNKWLWTGDGNTDATLNLLYNWQSGFEGTTNNVAPGKVADDRVTTYAGPYATYNSLLPKNRDAQALASLTVNHDLGWAKITSISGYHKLWDSFQVTQNAEPIHNPPLAGRAAVTALNFGHQQTFTEELQLKSPDEQDLHWIAGLYYLNDKTSYDVNDYRDGAFIVQGSSPNLIRGRQKTESYAGFLEASKTILPDTRLTLGARYTIDRKRLYGSISTLLANGSLLVTTPADPGVGVLPPQNPKTWQAVTYRAVLDHHFAPDIMAYASYNRGFKSGLFNIAVFTNPAVNPETIDAYEVGMKSELFGHRLRLNVSGFYYDYKNIQLRQTRSGQQATQGGASRFLLLNAANGTVKGVDADFTAVPVRNLTITGGFELLYANYGSFPGAPFGLANPVTLPLPAGCSLLSPLPASAALLGGNTTVVCDASGERMIRSPTFTGNIGATYTIDLANGGAMQFNVNDHYNSGFFWDVDHVLTQSAYHNVGASVTWTSAAGNWDVSIWGSNLSNAYILSTATNGATSIIAPGEPRMFGIKLSVRG